jgi:hypothetical protein
MCKQRFIFIHFRKFSLLYDKVNECFICLITIVDKRMLEKDPKKRWTAKKLLEVLLNYY